MKLTPELLAAMREELKDALLEGMSHVVVHEPVIKGDNSTRELSVEVTLPVWYVVCSM